MIRNDSQPGTEIGRYQVLGELGRGAMGIVLLALDPVLDREVALKYLRPDLDLPPQDRQALMQRMRHEAKAIARMSHPGIVALHDIGEDPVRGVFLVFERADGPTLEEALRRGRLTREGVARLARELGDALNNAHERKIVHRDVKPANLILTEEGAKVADFGVARLPNSTLTQAGAKVGTPAYSAPEAIARGEHSPASDQFSLAASLYEALSGSRAFPGEDTMAVAKSIELEQPLPIAAALGLPAKVDAILLRALAKKPKDRFKSCGEFGRALSEALAGAREMQPTLPDNKTLLKVDRSRGQRALGVALLWLLVGASIGVLVGRSLSPSPIPAPPAPTVPEPEARKIRPAYISPAPPGR